MRRPDILTLLIGFAVFGFERINKGGHLGAFTSLVAIAVFFLYLRSIYRNDKKYFLSSLYQIFYFLGLIISGLLVSNGFEMLEIGEVGYQNGTVGLLLAFFVVTTTAGKSGFKFASCQKMLQPRGRLSKKFENIVFASAFFLIAVTSIYVMLKYGTPYSSELARTAFWQKNIPDYLAWLGSGIKQCFNFTLIYYFSNKSGFSRRNGKIALIFLIFLTFALLGEKFSAFIIYASGVGLIVAAGSKQMIEKLKLFRYAITITLSLLIFTVISYSVVSSYDDLFFLYRIGMQSQVIWSVLNIDINNLLFNTDFGSFWGVGWKSPADMFSAQLLPDYLYRHYDETGTTLTGFMPALQIQSFGLMPSLLIHTGISYVLGMLAAISINTIKTNNQLLSFLGIKIYFSFVMFWYAAIHSAIFGVGFFATALAYIIIYLALMSNNNSIFLGQPTPKGEI